ncbi:uncharacterized protein GVI51_H06545 [Nakaseomyces glabratus]|uniref:Sugar utilization regulatory protein IMP2 n=1 Tax=Candida glabrata (strain ATCC 2001 / BCRC 20586 / JCM 3761 / NBRC 0622 / NRRL Y-65 / CBS 138) TaxID=284593 RepID=Q6FRQ8_CANGA|nr:uncharacterized protein CAGL0H06677g [Nakaseomyces glabratus]QHS66728.1 uncharacterized protein GVI51_H06545 [Nakaseomyces glabratus]CAG60019.1 unnamed protein product [Nakaseomyces glabratus]|eukprot:XP_447086.1 uncharacterized protein CAGL0H06677g [[Candida] glabrata]
MQKGILVPSGSERGPTEIQFDSEIGRGRSRDKRTGGNGAGRLSLSRSRSRASSRVREEEFLKWTVLRRDPSMRLTTLKKNKKSGSGTGGDDDDDDDEDDDDEDDDDEEESDEERVSDIENDAEIDEEFHFDLGTKVLPNFSTSINDVLENSKPWIQKYLSTLDMEKERAGVNFETLEGGYSRALELVRKGKGAEAHPETSKNYILCTDLSSESTYALTYVMGSLVSNGDTLYIVHWDGDSTTSTKDSFIDNALRVKKHVRHLMDCVSVIVDDLDVVIISLTHPYPKHLLNEMIHGLKPVTLACSLSLILSSLQNFVCSVPTLVIRKKLKRSRKKGISE